MIITIIVCESVGCVRNLLEIVSSSSEDSFPCQIPDQLTFIYEISDFDQILPSYISSYIYF